MKVVQCRSCSARIVWTTTVKDKAMPVDAEPVADGNVELQEDAGGDVHSRVITADRAPVSLGYVSHFATCPNAASHRR